MRRRDLLKVIVLASVWPLALHAQQPSKPVVGFLNAASASTYTPQVTAFLKGLSETGYVEGQNVLIEYRWAEGQTGRLPAMADELIRKQVTVIAATSTPAAVAAKAATGIIPIVFETGADPIKLGLISNLSRPGGNVTGVTQTNVEIAPKRLQLLHELVPAATVVGLLVNPADLTLAETYTTEVQAAAKALGVELHILNASSETDLDGAFAKLVQLRAGGLVISGGAFLTSQSEHLAALAVRYAVPTVFTNREFVVAGGLLGYGAAIVDAYRLVGIYTGRILKGDKPGELPVQQATRVELYINLKTAKALGLTVPNTLIGRADEVIE